MFPTHDCFCRMLWVASGKSDKYMRVYTQRGTIHYSLEGTMGEQGR